MSPKLKLGATVAILLGFAGLFEVQQLKIKRLCGTIRGPKWHTFAMRPQRPMCAMLSQRAASAGRMSFSLWDHGLQGHPQGCQLSGDHTPSLLSGRSWADKQGVSRAPA